MCGGMLLIEEIALFLMMETPKMDPEILKLIAQLPLLSLLALIALGAIILAVYAIHAVRGSSRGPKE